MHLLPRLDDTTICGGMEWRVFNCLIFLFQSKNVSISTGHNPHQKEKSSFENLGGGGHV